MTDSALLVQTLRLHHRLGAGELLRELGVSRATLMRALRAAGHEVLAAGRTRRTSYAARRPLRGSAAPLPLFRIDRQGRPAEVGRLHLAYPDETLVEGGPLNDWPLDREMQDGWFAGIPYPLQDMRPDGYLGRAFARRHASVLQVAEDPRQWSDDDALHALSLMGVDQSGCFVVGEAAYRLWLQRRAEPVAGIGDTQVGDAYTALAERSMQQGAAGSSAAGEFPKFTAVREIEGRTVHVLVKFSGSDDSSLTQRWADLLVCEHLALEVGATLSGLQVATSRIHRAGGRTFLEIERFDRHGAFGRSPLCSWAAVNNAWFGLSGRPWAEGGAKLLERQLVDAPTRDAIARQWHYGQLIGNSDMHDGNLSFIPHPEPGRSPTLRLAPMYDMLPMLYAPQRGVELAPRTFVARLPLPSEQALWLEAAQAAVEFWRRAGGDRRVSAAFREICRRNADIVREAAQVFSA